MLKRLVLAAVLFFVSGLVMTPVAHAHDTHIVGTLTEVEPYAISVMTDHHETVPVPVDAHTTYRKWLMAKPWQQDIHADIRSLRVGQRVHIELDQRNPITAETVWIVTGGVGLIY